MAVTIKCKRIHKKFNKNILSRKRSHKTMKIMRGSGNNTIQPTNVLLVGNPNIKFPNYANEIKEISVKKYEEKIKKNRNKIILMGDNRLTKTYDTDKELKQSLKGVKYVKDDWGTIKELKIVQNGNTFRLEIDEKKGFRKPLTPREKQGIVTKLEEKNKSVELILKPRPQPQPLPRPRPQPQPRPAQLVKPPIPTNKPPAPQPAPRPLQLVTPLIPTQKPPAPQPAPRPARPTQLVTTNKPPLVIPPIPTQKPPPIPTQKPPPIPTKKPPPPRPTQKPPPLVTHQPVIPPPLPKNRPAPRPAAHSEPQQPNLTQKPAIAKKPTLLQLPLIKSIPISPLIQLKPIPKPRNLTQKAQNRNISVISNALQPNLPNIQIRNSSNRTPLLKQNRPPGWRPPLPTKKAVAGQFPLLYSSRTRTPNKPAPNRPPPPPPQIKILSPAPAPVLENKIFSSKPPLTRKEKRQNTIERIKENIQTTYRHYFPKKRSPNLVRVYRYPWDTETTLKKKEEQAEKKNKKRLAQWEEKKQKTRLAQWEEKKQKTKKKII